MIYIVIGLSAFFILIGFTITASNAKFLLSGYNKMSEEQRAQVSLKNYFPFFRRFHLILGIATLIIGLALTLWVSEDSAVLFLVIGPLLAYIFFFWKSNQLSFGANPKVNKFSVIALVGSVLLAAGIFGFGLKEDVLSVDANKISLAGVYGEEIKPSKIRSIECVESLPSITIKVNGFSTGSIRKGYFKTTKGEKVKLVLNSSRDSYLLITKIDGSKIYYAGKSESSEEVLREISEKLPALQYK
ncbi:MAG: DUF3784 domain-containing protein [Crocinitomicaceae bacterium]